MRKIYLLFVFVLIAAFGFGQSAPGDIAIIAANCDGGDDFAFVTLVDIASGTEIFFTDNEWDGSAFNNLGEGELTWTNGGSTLSAGSVVVFTDPLSGGSVNVGSLSGTGWNLGASNEWFYALLEAPATSYGDAPVFLAAFANDAGSGWLTGTLLTEGNHAIDFNNDHDGFKYTGIRDGEASFSDYLALIYNSSNWQDETSNGENILPISTTAFSIAVPAGPQDPTDFTIDNTTSTQIGLSWTNAASTDGVWVVARQGAAPDVVIADGEGVYNYGDISATGNFSTDDDLEDAGYGGSVGNIVVYSGTGASCTVSGLTEGNDYYFTIFNEHGSADWSDGAQSTPTNDVAEVQGTSSFAATAGNEQASLSWTNNTGAIGAYWDQVLVVAKSGSAVSGTPSGDGSAYTANAAFGSGTDLGSGNYVVYNGTGTSETVTSLTNSTIYHFRTFVRHGSTWTDSDEYESANCTPSNTPSSGDIIINEIMYNSTGDDEEWIELYNTTGDDINLSADWELSSTNASWTYAFDGSKTITSGGYITIQVGSAGSFPYTPDIVRSSLANQLVNSTSTIALKYDASTINSVTYDDGSPWPTTPDGNGPSLELKDPSLDNSLAANWQASYITGGTPGIYNSTPGLWKVGAASNDWHTAANWSDENVPTSSVDVVIPVGATNYPTISAAANCDDLTIKSDADGDASLIGQGSLTVAGITTIERYVTKFTDDPNGWHFLSSPVASFTIALSDFDPTDNVEDLYRYGETTNEWLNHTGGDFTHTEFEVGLGYLIAYNTSEVREFSGVMNSSSKTKSLDYTVGQGDGWNLIGNPFTSAIDADLLTFTGSVGTGVYVVNPADGSYWAHNGVFGDPALADGEIPVHQGFFVKASGVGASVTIDPADQVHSSNDFNKNEQELPTESLVVTLRSENSENSTYFQFLNDATTSFDERTDAYKIFGWATIAQVYSELNDTKYSINCLPHSEETITVPLGLRLTADEDLTLDFSGLETFYNSIRIDLEDLQTGTTVNIRENPSYSFAAATSDTPNRFLLHFNGVTAIEDIEEAQAPIVYTVDHAIYINSGQALTADIFIYNINGQLVGQDKINGEQLKKVELQTSTGMYLVSIKTADAVYTEKVMIK